jgi:hypothetical protein
MNEFKLNNNETGIIIFIYQNYLLYTLKDDASNDLYAAKYTINGKNISLEPINDNEFKIINEKFEEERMKKND